MNRPYKISGIICTYNRAKYLPIVLESIVRQTLDKSQFELVIINNNSPDNSDEICAEFHRKHPEINYRYVHESKQGLSNARNRGIAESSGWLLTFIDDDAYLADDFLEQKLRHHEAHPEALATGGKILLYYEQHKPAWVNRFLSTLLGYFNLGDKECVFKGRKYPRGSNMTFRYDVFEKYGVFDPQLGRNKGNLNGSEEKEMFARIVPTGKVLYVPKAVVYHAVPLSRTTADFIKQQAMWVGRSQRYISSQSTKNLIKGTMSEAVKWAGSVVLFFVYCLIGRFAAGVMIVRFRWWVSAGFLSEKVK